MKIDEPGYVVLEPTDDGPTIERALGESLSRIRTSMDPAAGRLWLDRVIKARSVIPTNFGYVAGVGQVAPPKDQDTPLYITPDQLEYALVDHGVAELNSHGNQVTQEVVAVDGLLAQIDSLKVPNA